MKRHLPLIQRAEERNFLGKDESQNDEDEETSDNQTVEIDALRKGKDRNFSEIISIEERIKSLEDQYE